MFINRAELKQKAKESLRGKWGVSVGIILIFTLIVLAVYLIGFISALGLNPILYSIIMAIIGIAWFIVSPAFMLGMSMVFLKISRGEDVAIKNLFDGFLNFWKAFGLSFMIGLFTFLWSLLLIVPGIIAGLRYSMAFFILADNPDIGIMDAIRLSKDMTYGYKGELFVLGLSFIGWAILASIPLYIGYLWLIPYMWVAYSNFYNKLNVDAETIPELQPVK